MATYLVCIPIVVAPTYINLGPNAEHGHRPEFVPYDYLRVRTKVKMNIVLKRSTHFSGGGVHFIISIRFLNSFSIFVLILFNQNGYQCLITTGDWFFIEPKEYVGFCSPNDFFSHG